MNSKAREGAFFIPDAEGIKAYIRDYSDPIMFNHLHPQHEGYHCHLPPDQDECHQHDQWPWPDTIVLPYHRQVVEGILPPELLSFAPADTLAMMQESAAASCAFSDHDVQYSGPVPDRNFTSDDWGARYMSTNAVGEILCTYIFKASTEPDLANMYNGLLKFFSCALLVAFVGICNGFMLFVLIGMACAACGCKDGGGGSGSGGWSGCGGGGGGGCGGGGGGGCGGGG